MEGDSPTTFLKTGASLRGKDVLPVVKRLMASTELQEQEYCSLSRRHLLSSYTEEELGTEFKKLTGYDITVSWGGNYRDFRKILFSS